MRERTATRSCSSGVASLIPSRGERRHDVARLDFIELVPHLHRWCFDLVTGTTRAKQLDDLAAQLPRVNDRHQGEKLRHSYNPTTSPRAELMFDGLRKYDLERGTSQQHGYAKGWYGSEAGFVTRGQSEGSSGGEDDGWLVTYLSNATDLRVVCRIELPQHVPIDFHTCWVSTATRAARRATSSRARPRSGSRCLAPRARGAGRPAPRGAT